MSWVRFPESFFRLTPFQQKVHGKACHNHNDQWTDDDCCENCQAFLDDEVGKKQNAYSCRHEQQSHFFQKQRADVFYGSDAYNLKQQQSCEDDHAEQGRRKRPAKEADKQSADELYGDKAGKACKKWGSSQF